MSPSECYFSYGEFHEGLTSRCTVFVFSTWPIWRNFIIARGISQFCNQLSKLRSTSSTSSSTSFSMISGSSKKSVCYVLAPKVGDTGVAFGQVFETTTETNLLLLVAPCTKIFQHSVSRFFILANKNGF